MKTSIISILCILLLMSCSTNEQSTINISYPLNKSVFPPDIIAPTIKWNDNNKANKEWNVHISQNQTSIFTKHVKGSKSILVDKDVWKEIASKNIGDSLTITIQSATNKNNKHSTSFIISSDSVAAPIFYRAVTLPFKFARDNMKTIKWYIGDISSYNKPHKALSDIPICGNCHSFSANGEKMAMDVDARDEKGAYAIAKIEEDVDITDKSLINWSDFQDGKLTYGLLSQLSPNGRYVVSTLKDCEIFIDRPNIAYSQLFFPVKGILVVYDTELETYTELNGANDTMFVHSNPTWSPDGKYIYYTRARAKHFEESGITAGSRATDYNKYLKFEKSYTSRDSLMKYDIIRIPFNNGKGGESQVIVSSSLNGKSNYFPRISHDGKWLVFCQAEGFMLLQEDSKLFIVSTDGGTPKQMNCNTSNMNSWHSWSPNNKWMVFSSKEHGIFTQLYLTHIDENGNDSPPILLDNLSFDKHANNIPEFVNIKHNKKFTLHPKFLDDVEFSIRKGEILMSENKLDEALDVFNVAIKKYPNNADSYFNIGKIYSKKKNYKLAILNFTKAINIKPISEHFVFRGSAYQKSGDKNNALTNFNQAIKLHPNEYRAYTNRGQLMYSINEYKKAEADLKKSIALNPVNTFSHYYLGLVKVANKEFVEAEKCLTKSLDNADHQEMMSILKARLRVRLVLKKYNDVIADCDKAISVNPKDASLYQFKAVAEEKLGYTEQAKQTMIKARKLGLKPPNQQVNN